VRRGLVPALDTSIVVLNSAWPGPTSPIGIPSDVRPPPPRCHPPTGRPPRRPPPRSVCPPRCRMLIAPLFPLPLLHPLPVSGRPFPRRQRPPGLAWPPPPPLPLPPPPLLLLPALPPAARAFAPPWCFPAAAATTQMPGARAWLGLTAVPAPPAALSDLACPRHPPAPPLQRPPAAPTLAARCSCCH